MNTPSRRILLQRGFQALVALAVAPLAVARARAAASCSEAASESLRTSLNYKDVAPSATQSCSLCAFFTAGAACGNCTIMSDKVSAAGHCDSWSAKS
jgi:hypothetical protein